MLREVKLIEHLPLFIQEYREIKHIMTAENPEFQLICDESERIKNNQFIQSCDLNGIARFEKILKITPSDGETLQLRISRVLAKWNDAIPYTWKTLIDKLDILCGADNYVVELDTDNYKINVAVKLSAKSAFDAIIATMEDVVPANMICTCGLIYNVHDVLAKYPHYILMQFTHQELRDTVIGESISASVDNLANYTMENIKSISCECISTFGMRKV